MIGHLNPDITNLNCSSNYRIAYCSLCKNLREENGTLSGLMISNEVTFVVSAFSRYLDKIISSTNCPATLYTKKKTTYSNKTIFVASKFSMLLGGLKILDSIVDEQTIVAKARGIIYKNEIEKIKNSCSSDMNILLNQYKKLITSESNNFQQTINLSGKLSRQITVEIGNTTNAGKLIINKLSNMFEEIGTLIPIYDALADFKEDLKRKKYNPILFQSIENKSNFEIEFSKLELNFYNKLYSIISQTCKLKQDKIIESEFSLKLISALNRMESHVVKVRKLNFSKLTEEEKKALSKIHNDSDLCFGGCCSCGECGFKFFWSENNSKKKKKNISKNEKRESSKIKLKIKKLIADDEPLKALEELLELVQGNSEKLENECWLHYHNLNKLNLQVRQGRISHEKESETRSKIIHSILSLSDLIENEINGEK